MKITEIAARLSTIGANMEVLAICDGDLDYPDEMMLLFLVNASEICEDRPSRRRCDAIRLTVVK